MAVHRASVALVVTVWISVTLFGAYILAHYAGAVTDSDLPSWNGVLPRLYKPTTPAATVAIGVHFLAGGVIPVLGCVQLLTSVRTRWPAVRRWLGRVYVVACVLAGLGELGFIAAKGAVDCSPWPSAPGSTGWSTASGCCWSERSGIPTTSAAGSTT